MSNSAEIHWQQRFFDIESALVLLDEACAQDTYSKLEGAGVIHIFRICIELSWRVLKDVLFYDGIDEGVPRSIIRRAFEVGYIDSHDCETLLVALKKLHTLNQAHLEPVAVQTISLIKIQHLPAFKRLHVTLLERDNR